MERNDKLFMAGIALTALLVAIPTVLLKAELAGFELLLFAGWACGFAFSWFFWRARESRMHHVLSALGVVAIAVWMGWAIANSSFGYKEVVLICLKGVLLLTAVLAFFVPSLPYLVSIQYLSLPVFLGQALYSSYAGAAGGFISGTVLYLIVWMMVIRLRLVCMTDGRGSQQFAGPVSVIVLAVFFTSSFGSAHYVVKHFAGPKVRYDGILLDEKRDDSGCSEEEYYGKLDQFQKDLVKYIPDLKSKEERQKVLLYLATLTKEAAGSLATSKAEGGIRAAVSDPREGIVQDDVRRRLREELMSFIDTKISYQQAKGKTELLAEVKQGQCDLKTRFKLLKGLQSMSAARERTKIAEKERALNAEVEKMSGTGAQKTRLTQAVGRVSQWKMFELYKQKVKKIEGRLESEAKDGKKDREGGVKSVDEGGRQDRAKGTPARSSGGEYVPGDDSIAGGKPDGKDRVGKRVIEQDEGGNGETQEMRKLLDRIKAAGELPEMKDADGVLKRLQRSLREREAGLAELKKLEGEIRKLVKEQKEHAGELEDLLKLKVEMLVRQLASDLQEKAGQDPETSPYFKDQLNKDIQRLRDAKGAQEIKQAAESLETHLAGNEHLTPDAEELTAAKLFQRKLDAVERLNSALDRATQEHERVRDFQKRLDQTLARDDQARRESELGELEAAADAFKQDGLIDSGEHAEVRESLKELRELSQQESAAADAKERGDERKDPSGAGSDLGRLVEEAGFEPSVRDALANFLKGAQQAQTVSQLEDVQVAWNGQSHELRTATERKKDFDQFKEQFDELLQARRTLLMERQMASLREKLDQLDRIDPAKREELERKLDEITKSGSMQEMREEIEKLGKDIERIMKEEGDRKGEKQSADEKSQDTTAGAEHVKEQLAAVNAKIKDLERQLVQSDQDREQIMDQLNKAVQEKQELEQRLEELNSRKDEYERSLPEEKREERAQADQKDEERKVEIERQQAAVDQELSQQEKELDRLKQQEKKLISRLAQNEAAEIQEAVRQLKETAGKQERADVQKRELEEKVKALEERKLEMERQPLTQDARQKDEVERQLESAKQELQRAEQEIARLELQEEQGIAQLQQKGAADVQELVRQLEETAERKKDAAEKKAALERKAEELAERKTDINEQQLSRIPQAERELRENAEQRMATEEKIETAEKERKTLERELADLEEKKREVEEDLRREYSDRDALSQQLEEIGQRKEDVQRKLEEITSAGGDGGGSGIYVLPYRLVASIGTAVQLTAIAVMDNVYVKDITHEAEWSSETPEIVSVDKGGRVICIAPGVGRVAVMFKDGGHRTIDVAVGDAETEYMKGIRGMIR